MKTTEQRFQDDVERIRKWYEDDERNPLSDSLFGRLERWKKIHDYILVQQPLTDTFVVRWVAETFGVSEPQAWRDVRDGKKFFALNDPGDEKFERMMLITSIKSTRTKAELANDHKTVANCNTSLTRLGVGRKEEKPAEVSKTIILEICFDPKLIGAKDNPNLVSEVEKFIGEAAKRELVVTDE
jgi:hypothetical protein